MRLWIVALTDRARNEPRDLYDVWYLTSEGHVDLAMLTSEIESLEDVFRSVRRSLRAAGLI
jgi:predicted nucleotidyltransferase component of viral defense system